MTDIFVGGEGGISLTFFFGTDIFLEREEGEGGSNHNLATSGNPSVLGGPVSGHY